MTYYRVSPGSIEVNIVPHLRSRIVYSLAQKKWLYSISYMGKGRSQFDLSREYIASPSKKDVERDILYLLLEEKSKLFKMLFK